MDQGLKLTSAFFHKTVIKTDPPAGKLGYTSLEERSSVKALKKARKLIETAPASDEARILSALVVALESESPYPLTDLYKLGYDNFELALELLQEWRLDRYYMSKVRLLDISVQLGEMGKAEEPAAKAS